MRPNRVFMCLLVVLLLGVLLAAVYGKAHEMSDLRLRAGYVLSSSPTELRLLVVNQGKETVLLTPVGVSHNKLVFITPAGKEVAFQVWKDLPKSKLIHLGPSKGKTWELEIDRILVAKGLTQPGWYGVYWAIRDKKSQTLLFYKPEVRSKESPKGRSKNVKTNTELGKGEANTDADEKR